MNMENIEDFDEEKSASRKTISVSIFGLVIVVAVVLGTIGSAEYFLGQTKLATPRRTQPEADLGLWILSKEGIYSVLYSSISGLEREVYRDTADIVNPTNIIGGFAFCKEDEDGKNAVYSKLFDSFDPPIKAEGVSPLNCLFTIYPIDKMIYYVGKDPNTGSNVVYGRDMLNLSNPSEIVFARDLTIDIVSRPFKVNSKDYVYVEKKDYSETRELVRHNALNGKLKYLYKADHPFDFITAKEGSVAAVLDPDSDYIKIFKNFDKATQRIFTTKRATIKKIIFSSSGDSIFCLICSKNQAGKCKVIEVSLKEDKPERTRDLIKTIEPDADIFLIR